MNTSMSLSRCTSTSQFKFSSEEIVLNDEDLLTLILLRVPYRKLKSLKCVSKKWLYLITTPQFTCLRCSLLPLRASGLFIQFPPLPLFVEPFTNEVYFVPLDDPNTPSPFRTLAFANDPFDPERIRILGSCNGLLLCSTHPLALPEKSNTYVYNPSTNQLAILPKYPPPNGVVYISLAFDPSKSPHYKVIAYVTTSRSDSIGDFHVYSSETGTWRVSVQSFHRPPDMYLSRGVYCHMCIHWLGDIDGSNVFDHRLYFNVDEGRLGTFPRPPIDDKLILGSSYFGESEGHLHFIGVYPNATSLSVYEMKSDYSEWFIKYWIDLAPISKVFPEMTNHEACYQYGHNYAIAVHPLIRRENFQEDSFLVLEIPGKVIRYNLVDKRFKAIWDFAVDFAMEEVDRWRFGRFRVWQYIELGESTVRFGSVFG